MKFGLRFSLSLIGTLASFRAVKEREKKILCKFVLDVTLTQQIGKVVRGTMGKLFQRKLSHLPSLIKIPGTQSLKREHRRCYRITPHPSPSSSLFFFPLSLLFPSRVFLPPFLPALETWELLLRRMKNIIIFLTALIGWDNIIFLLTRLIWSIFLPPLLFQTLTFPHSLSLSCALSLDLNLISFWGIWIWIPVFIQVWGRFLEKATPGEHSSLSSYRLRPLPW